MNGSFSDTFKYLEDNIKWRIINDEMDDCDMDIQAF